MAVLWHPDTCGCQFEVANDWSTATTVNVCGIHLPMVQSGQDLWSLVRNENAYKNIVCGFIVEQYPQFSGSFSYDAQDNLVVDVSDLRLSAADATSLQNSINDHFGSGHTVVVGSSTQAG